MSGVVFNIQRFSLFDGPGVRTVAFLKGCPLRCRWCHNPEGLAPCPQIMYQPARCIACGACADLCARHSLAEGQHAYDRESCTGCGQCAEACVSGALTLSGRRMEASEVIQEALRDLPTYLESGGGLTLSGGEPFFQGEFTLELLMAAKEAGLHICIETSGQAAPDILRAAARYTDLFYYDYKATGEDMHRSLCGTGQRLILKNLALLDELQAPVTLRCPIVPGANDVPAHIKGIARTAAAHHCIQEIHLEPYHRLGLSKCTQLGLPPAFESTPPAHETMEAYRQDIARATGKPCLIS